MAIWIVAGAGPEQFNTLCKITEVWDKNSKKLVIALWSLIHRTKYAWWNMSEIVSKDFDARFVSFDWPKQEFDNKKVLAQIDEYIKNSNAEEIVLAWLSFWDIVVKQLIDKLSPETKVKIKWHISISWVSDFKNLAWMDAISNLKWLISNKIFWILVAKPLAWITWKIDRWSKLNHFASKNMVDPNTSEMKENPKKLNRHIKAASIWLNPWLVNRFQKMLENDYSFPDIEWKNKDIPTFAIYSSNDGTFKNPKENAQKVLQWREKTQLIEIKDWWHAALVEQPEKYDKEITNILNKIFVS